MDIDNPVDTPRHSRSRESGNIPPDVNPFEALLNGSRLLKFDVSYNGRTTTYSLYDYETIAALKRAIMRDTGVPVHAQNLTGWRQGDIVNNEVVLSSLHLPINTGLTMNAVDPAEMSKPSGAAASSLSLDVVDLDTSETFPLELAEDATVGQLKNRIRDLTDIPPVKQVWGGFPPAWTTGDDAVNLGQLGLDRPRHVLSVQRSAMPVTNNGPAPFFNHTAAITPDDSPEQSSAEFIAGFSGRSSPPRAAPDLPLIPGDMDSIEDSLENFIRIFQSRYGDIHPAFSASPLGEVATAISKVPVKERKPLVLYLHDDSSVSANVFCSQILCNQQMTNYLNANFVTWPWDFTVRENKQKFLDMCTGVLGGNVTRTVAALPLQQYPVFIVLFYTRATFSVQTVIPGSSSVDEVMSGLLHAHDDIIVEMGDEVRDEQARQQRTEMRRELDAAYLQSLEEDQKKEEAKRVADAVRQAEEASEAAQVKKVEDRKEQLAYALPSEPSADSKEAITTFRIRLPDGTTAERRFLAKDKLADLFHFVGSRGYFLTEYRITTSFPKRDITEKDPATTFDAAGLCPREALLVEHR